MLGLLAVQGLSLVVESGGDSLVVVCELVGFSGGYIWAQYLGFKVQAK